jgi:predicted dehydrogenase
MGVRGNQPQTEMLDIPNTNQFAAEMDHFAQCVANDQTPRTPGEEGLQDLKIIKKLYEAAESGRTVSV